MKRGLAMAILVTGCSFSPDSAGSGADGPVTMPPSDGAVNDAGAVPDMMQQPMIDAGMPMTVAELQDLRIELPCAEPRDAIGCTTSTMATHTAGTVAPTTATIYDVTVHVHGEAEQATYQGGTPLGGYLLAGGTTSGDGWNTYRLDISEPAQTWYLNSGTSGQIRTWLLDYTFTATIAEHATVTLTAATDDPAEVQNRDGAGGQILVPGVPPDPLPYDGQFIHLTVDSWIMR